jgi:alkanesulfonate monooxygenase SsuD/methylene tetrahydromethanopterin reductase-like flavin-dependent oxidoreductase (luciferase family)
MDVAIMVEGQWGLNWPRWQRIARAVEDLGFAGLYRSDHITNQEPPYQDSLELWVSLTWLADHTQRIAFGPLVSPVSLRHPVMTARMAGAVDDLSGGRLHLGLGAGWQEREHTGYGFDLLDMPRRLARFQEGVEVITHLLRSDAPVSLEGTFYRLHDTILLPRPQRPGGRGVLPLAARYADEWNVAFKPPAAFAALSARLDTLLQEQGRRPGDVRRSLMTGLSFGRNDQELQHRLSRWNRTAEELRAGGLMVGTGAAVVDQLGRLAEAGVQRVMLQWLDLDDVDGLAALAQAVLPQL